jgi:hypothetical protein
MLHVLDQVLGKSGLENDLLGDATETALAQLNTYLREEEARNMIMNKIFAQMEVLHRGATEEDMQAVLKVCCFLVCIFP